MEKGLLPELVQVHFSARVTVSSSGPRATEDSKAVPMRAVSRIKYLAAGRFPRLFPVRIKVEEVQVVVPVVMYGEVPAAMVADSMVEGVVKGNSAML
ncbi:MAG: hypothetical protein HGB21_00600 [Nitrospirae bacterium]|nr:hypothetical protein [Nitrospirota bacterium]NTW64800.1 hypothetical protein [Nitrospirota bacterium]